MPPPNARQKAARKKLRNERGLLIAQPKSINNLKADDINTVEPPPLETNNNDAISRLIDTTQVKTNRPRTYTKTSRTTLWRNKRASSKVDEKGKLSSFGFLPAPRVEEQQPPILSRSQKEINDINAVISDLYKLTKPVMNKKHPGHLVDLYDFTRYQSIKYYFMLRLEGEKKGKASCEAAKLFWPGYNEAYYARAIIKWANEFIQNRKLSDDQQDTHK